MPKTADPAIRTALIEQAARITAEEGRDALTLRRLATEVGTSTMAVYTHFGGMEDLRLAVRREGFARLAAHLDTVDPTGDAVADLIVLGWAYYVNATTNPNLYRAMFMDRRCDDGAPIGSDTFQRLVNSVERCIAAGRFDQADAVELAMQVWASEHGVVSLQMAGMLTEDQAVACWRTMARSLALAFGDAPSALRRSLGRAEPRFETVSPSVPGEPSPAPAVG